jgi:hypothetical protein
MAKKRVKRGYFSKVSTGKIPVFTGPVDFLNRAGPAGPIPVYRTGSSSAIVCIGSSYCNVYRYTLKS